MVEIADIKGRDSLKTWLGDQPREVSVWIASRAAARVLPVWWQAVLTEEWARKRDLTALPILRSLLISSVAAKMPTEEMKAARVANAGAAMAYVNVNSHVGHAFAATGAAAKVAPYAAANAAANAAVANVAEAVSDAAAAAADAGSNAAAAARSVWNAVRLDAAQVSNGDIPWFLPLWGDARDPLADVWKEVQAKVQVSEAADDWQFWIDWYQAQLDGRPMLGDEARTWEMLEKIALIDPKDWDQGPEVVNPVINGIWGEYKSGGAPRELEVLQAADDGIVLAYNPETDRLYQEDIEAERPNRLEIAVAKLNEARLLVDGMGNLQGVLKSELFLIERAVEHHPGNAVMVYFNAKSARGLLQGNIANGACPSAKDEPVIGLLDTILLDTQNTLLPEPAVRESLPERAEDSELLDQPEALDALERAADEIGEVAEGPLAEELPENAEVAKDVHQPRAVRLAALLGTVSAVVQAWVIAGYVKFDKAWAEIEKTTARGVRISRNIALIGGGLAAGATALASVVNSPAVKAAIEWIIKLF